MTPFPNPNSTRIILRSICAVFLAGALVFSGCSTQPYDAREGLTELSTDNLVRYGGPAALGVGGYFAGKAIGHSTSAGILGAVAGVALGSGFDIFSDAKRKEAYQVGMEDGANEARAEQSIDLWRREAVYNAPGTSGTPGQPSYRTVYVPSRSINGVTYPGGYQEVQVLH